MSPGLPDSFRLKVITPRRLLADADVQEASVPALDGLIGVRPGHRPLMTALGRGTLTYRQGKDEESFEVEGGYAEILPDEVLIFTQSRDEAP